MKRTPVNSTMVASLGYDEATQTLEVEFVSNAEIYQYKAVPKEVFLDLLSAPSKGKYMRQRIMDHYETEKISGKAS
ncbi:MAG: KTSC domain-containing protein [Thermonemataceae bacterium]